MLIKEYNKEEINKFYNWCRQEYSKDNINKRKYGDYPVTGDPRSGKVGWHDQKIQYKRFECLLNIGVKNGDSILDFGCGLGDLYGYTKKINLNVDYVGVDINQDHIAEAKDTYESKLRHLIPFKKSKCEFHVINTIEDVHRDFDWFLASGSFTIGFDMDEIMEVIDKAYYKSYKGVAFNLLIKKDWIFADKEFFTTGYYGAVLYNPEFVLKRLKQKYPNVYSMDSDLNYQSKWGPIDDYTFYIKK